MAAIPKKAATVILLRERSPEGIEVFLLKRHEKSSFFAGNFVYPGGRVDREDGSVEMCAQCRGVSPEEAQQQFKGTLSPEESLAHWVAAIRELFEEAGVLLACDQNGKVSYSKDQTRREEVSHYRELIQNKKVDICQLAREKEFYFALDQLHYYAHWITPEARPERFDTRFFVACHPEGQEATFDQKETTVGVWVTPQKALEENLKANIVLSPPTLKTIEDLSRFKSINDLLRSLKENQIEPILPVLTKVADEPMIIFPWDPEYEKYKCGHPSLPVDHGRPSRSDDNTTRVVLREGRWLRYCRTC
jgi:8-oxo-dGTP pyrophosphatase MutT (NUDIX family)